MEGILERLGWIVLIIELKHLVPERKDSINYFHQLVLQLKELLEY